MEPIKWDLMDQFKEQQKSRQEGFENRRKNLQDCQERLNKAQYKSQELWFRETRGEEVEEEKKQTQAEFDEARKAYESAMKDMQNPERHEEEITPEKLAKDWNENIHPKIKEHHLKPIANKMKKARYHYLASLKEYYTMLDSYRDNVNEVSNLGITWSMQRGEEPTNLNTLNDWNELPLVKQEHLNTIVYERELPDEVKKDLKSD